MQADQRLLILSLFILVDSDDTFNFNRSFKIIQIKT